ncbi:MAG TPA: MauE/DoxX family redox-associated membrane protein, partial [Nakamurella sp.]
MSLSRTRPRVVLVRDAVGLLARCALAAVWFVSGIAKAVDPRETVVAVRAYDLFPESLVGVIAAILPYFELALG